MSTLRSPMFLKPKVYRARRLRDAARLLPILGGFLFLLPVLWSQSGGTSTMASDGIYLFAVWIGLVAIAAALARGLVRDGADDDADTDTGPDTKTGADTETGPDTGPAHGVPSGHDMPPTLAEGHR